MEQRTRSRTLFEKNIFSKKCNQLRNYVLLQQKPTTVINIFSSSTWVYGDIFCHVCYFMAFSIIDMTLFNPRTF